MTGTGNVMIFKQFVECIRLVTQSHEALLAGGIIRFLVPAFVVLFTEFFW